MPNQPNPTRSPNPRKGDFWGFRTSDKKPLVASWTSTALFPASDVKLKLGEGFGVDCGRNGLVVIDIDSRKALKVFRDLWIENEGTSRLKTTFVKTPRGHHIYFNAIDDHPVKNSVGKLAPNIDVRTAGGYVIAPPTPGYEHLLKSPTRDLPLWLANLLSPSDSPVRRTDAKGGDAKHSVIGIMQTLANAPEGQRNSTLYWALNRVSEMPTPKHQRLIRQISREARHLGLPDWEINQTIDSVFGGRRG